MQKTESLERIPFDSSYEGRRGNFWRMADAIIKSEPIRTFSDGAEGCLQLIFDTDFEENGMDALVDIVIAFLYVIEHNEVDMELQGATEWYIEMFENGDYDDLFEEEDLNMLKEDIKIVKKYLKEHPTD